MPKNDFETIIGDAISALQMPAGRSERFASLDAIKQNRDDFVLECHKTWKHWHGEAVEQILIFDSIARREKTQPIGKGMAAFADYNRNIWRRVNDAIVWSLVGARRHVVKRFCLYRPRSYLSESNAGSVLRTLAALNARPMSLAIWNDATSCIDIGDVTYVEDGRSPEPTFIELKEGKVNEEILDLLQLDGAERDAKFQEFVEKYDKHGVKQFHRVFRQKRTSDQALQLLANERGTDPVTGLHIEIVDVGSELETYDVALDRFLCDALERRVEAIDLVADCIWVYANGDPTVTQSTAVARFQELLTSRGVRGLSTTTSRPPTHDRDRIVSLNTTFFQPMAKPLFIRLLDSRVLASVTYGDLRNKVFLYLDWKRFADVVSELNLRFTWSSEKAGRQMLAMKQAERSPLFAGRIAEVHVGPVRMHVTDPDLVQIYCDGVTPRAVVEKMIPVAEHIQRNTPAK